MKFSLALLALASTLAAATGGHEHEGPQKTTVTDYTTTYTTDHPVTSKLSHHNLTFHIFLEANDPKKKKCHNIWRINSTLVLPRQPSITTLHHKNANVTLATKYEHGKTKVETYTTVSTVVSKFKSRPDIPAFFPNMS